jgi:hypothetical protein
MTVGKNCYTRWLFVVTICLDSRSLGFYFYSIHLHPMSTGLTKDILVNGFETSSINFQHFVNKLKSVAFNQKAIPMYVFSHRW